MIITKAVTCPKCGNPLTAHTSLGEAAIPAIGDISLCFWCCTILEYTEGMTLSLLPDKELKRLALEQPEEFAALMAAREECRKKNDNYMN